MINVSQRMFKLMIAQQLPLKVKVLNFITNKIKLHYKAKLKTKIFIRVITRNRLTTYNVNALHEILEK